MKTIRGVVVAEGAAGGWVMGAATLTVVDLLGTSLVQGTPVLTL